MQPCSSQTLARSPGSGNETTLFQTLRREQEICPILQLVSFPNQFLDWPENKGTYEGGSTVKNYKNVLVPPLPSCT